MNCRKSCKHKQESLQRGLDWLMAQQAEDGGWHSKTYGPFKGGAATTALALYSISRLPVDVRCEHMNACQRGWKISGAWRARRIRGLSRRHDGRTGLCHRAGAVSAKSLRLDVDSNLAAAMEDFLLRERCAKDAVSRRTIPTTVAGISQGKRLAGRNAGHQCQHHALHRRLSGEVESIGNQKRSRYLDHACAEFARRWWILLSPPTRS